MKGILSSLLLVQLWGKTALALNIAKHVATIERKPAVIFSLEMGAEELIERMVASEGMIPGYH